LDRVRPDGLTDQGVGATCFERKSRTACRRLKEAIVIAGVPKQVLHLAAKLGVSSALGVEEAFPRAGVYI